ncbi:hypothetical protein ISO99_02225 [Staphylococcus sp. 18_1_E_LY]|uniref:Uncharacterized protein n=1 Tax=Staphylococcus lloydii TaxID=2781774 RepID=A0A7T1F8W8_9STAP|nr:hypothetical protein [Staphylococcus lloydii]MBF7018715.1 hypothetical protein [Staphylococcus lloydii]MBF7026443.1 hypothetical protein [Staphylococcus lloydii]QPM74116.1 hypothetical protein ISP08_07085 [Staphylococcus lloydii]
MSRMIYKDVIIIVESNNIFKSKQQHMNDKINKLEICGENVWKPKLSKQEKDVLYIYRQNEVKVINAILNCNSKQIAEVI